MDGTPDLGVGYEVCLDSRPYQQQENGRAETAEPVAGWERMVAVEKPAGRPNSDPRELERSVWKVGERACAVGRKASAYEHAGHKKIRRHEHVGKRAGRARTLGADEPERERPNGMGGVVGGDGEHAREGGGRIVGGGEREVEQVAGKRGTTGQGCHEQGGDEREPAQARIGQEPSTQRIRANYAKRAHGRAEAQDWGSHWDTAQPPGTEASRASVT